MRYYLTILLFICWSTSFSATYEDGENAYKKGDYSKAMAIWLPLAEQGDANAQYKIGKMYDKGQGQKQNQNEAFIWFKVAAEKNNIDAQAAIGEMYLKGEGVKQDNTEAFKWNKVAAIQGEPTGQNNLGVMYAAGMGVEKNYKEAMKWFELSLKNEESYDGYINLGWCYENGFGVEKNYIKAANFYQKAINLGIRTGAKQKSIDEARSRIENVEAKLAKMKYTKKIKSNSSMQIDNDPLNIRN